MSTVITNHAEKCETALAALRHVIDPEIGLNIVDLGLLYQIDFDEGNKLVYVSMTLTTQFCPMGDSIRTHAVAVLQGAFHGYDVHLELVFVLPWSADRISEQGREFLNR